MFSLDEKANSANSMQFHSVQTLIIGRLIVIFLLLVTSWAWYSGTLDLTLESFPKGPFLIFVISVGLTAVYFLLLRLSKQLAWQVRAQFVIDALLITWLVWRTGDLTSPYITLYIVLIGVSSVYLRPRVTLVMALICVALFVLLAALTALALIETWGAQHTLARLIQIVSFHVVAFVVVGLLASKLSERRFSGQELLEATKNLANLRALHERIIESIRSGLITTDLEGKIYTFNTAAVEITGCKAEEMVGKSIFSLFGDIRQSIEISLAAADEGEQQPRFEADLDTPDGFAVRIGYGISQLFSEDNQRSGLIITFQDLTEIRSMEESVRRKDRLAAVGRVGAGLAHEIRNPLGAMRGAIQVLESNMPPNSVQSDLMGIILRESDRLNSIITNFLSYAKPKVGNFVETDACEAIRDTMKLLRHSPDVQPNHKLEEILPASPVFILADSTQLKQVFWNLSRNAINAMPDGGTLKIGLENVPNNRVRIVFEDTGRGMSAEHVEQLFEPFAKSTSGGTGLGLSIVYQIIRDHNGTINVRSFEGEGTTITIELPREHRRHKAVDSSGDIHVSTEPSRLNQYLQVKAEKSVFSS
jgi:two-component system sensor histidine kinase PilS (NtrC family)